MRKPNWKRRGTPPPWSPERHEMLVMLANAKLKARIAALPIARNDPQMQEFLLKHPGLLENL